jgi:RimJ/RimL family protein N-acetyltransferase
MLAASDLEPFQAYRTDPEIGRYQGWTPMSSTDAQAFLLEMATVRLFQPDRWFQIAIAHLQTNQLIGDIGICVHSDDENFAEIGFSLDYAWQKQGLGAEAVTEALVWIFEHTQVTYVIATTDARNLPSVRLLKRVGMALRETKPAIFRGETCTEHVFEVRRSDFSASRL